CAAASISAGRYGCMLLVGLVLETGDYTGSASPDLSLGSHTVRTQVAECQLATRVTIASTANNPAATMRTALNGILFAANLPTRTTGTSAISIPSVVPATTAT